MKTEILIDRLENRIDSFWYFEQDIARIQIPNGKKLYAESRGEISVMIEEDTIHLNGVNAVDRAIELEYSDEGLGNIYEYDGWRMNNWFAIILVDIDGNRIGDDLGISGDYDEAITMLEAVAKEEINKQYM